MTTTEIQLILEAVAQRTRSVADAERAILEPHSASANRLKAFVTGAVLLLFLGIGLFLFYHAWQTTMAQRTASAPFRQTSGTVVRMVQKTNGHRLWAPIVTYRVSGKEYAFESELASRPPAYQVGEEVVVQYDPNQPQKATIDSFWMSWLPWLLFGGFGSLLVFVSIVGLVTIWRRRSEPTPQLVQQTLVLIAAGAMSVAEGTQRLTGQTTTSSRTKSPSVAGRLVVGALLIAVIYFSLQSMGKSWRLLVHGFKTDGKVVALVHNAKKSSVAPVVRYSVDGKPYELTGNTYSSPAAYQIGEQVTVLYEPESPDVGAVQSLSEQWLGPLLGLGLAGCFLVIFFRVRIKTRA